MVRPVLIAAGWMLGSVLCGPASAGQAGAEQAGAGQADFAAAEAFTPKAVARLLYGDAAGGDPARRDDAFDGRYAVGFGRPRWTQGARYWFVHRDRKGPTLLLGDAATGARAEYTGAQLLAATGAPVSVASLATLRVQDVDAAGDVRFDAAGQTWRWTPGAARAALLSPPPASVLEEAVPVPGGGWLGVRDRNLWWQRADGRLVALSQDAGPWRSFGREAGISDTQTPLRDRMGWFADGRRFWVERGDNRQVGASWVVDTLANPRPTLQEMRYALPGEPHLPVTELWVGDTANATLTRVDTERWPGQFLGSTDIGQAQSGAIRAGGRTERLYFVRMSRGYGEVELVVADPATGRSQVLLHERGVPYFSIRSPVFRVLDDGGFLWLSDRSGWNHLYRYDAQGRPVATLTTGAFNVAQVLGVDEAGGWVYFSGYGREQGRHRHYAHTYRVALQGGEVELLTPEDAHHQSSLSPDGRWLLDVHSRHDQPPVVMLRASDGGDAVQLASLDIAPLRAAGWQPPELFETVAADGRTILHGGLWKPFDFDPRRHYPVVAWVMPNSSSAGSIPVGFDPASPMQALAQLGFVVVTSATRGQAQGIRDKAYLVHGHGDMRDYPLADSRSSLEQVAASRPWMDLGRVGVTGYSGGGLMSASLLLTYPDLYRVGVSGGGNHDNNVYEWSSTEHYYGLKTPIADNAALASRLRGRLLLAHADTDRDVHFAHAMRLADALLAAGKRFDFLPIPSRDHDLGDRQSYFQRARWAYFAEHLLGDRDVPTDLWRLDGNADESN